AEELRVESGDVVDKTGAPCGHLACSFRIDIKKRIGIPAVGGNLRHRIARLFQHCPKGVGIGRTWESCGKPDNGDSLSIGFFQLPDPGTQSLDGKEGIPLEIDHAPLLLRSTS